MNLEKLSIVTFLSWILQISLAKEGTIRYCVPETIVYGSGTLERVCDRFNTIQHEIQCVTAEDRLGCFIMLTQGKADFMVAEPEDLRLMKAFHGSDVMVTHQLKKFAKSMPQQDVEMIVLVMKNESDSRPYTTQGKKLCYLGLEESGLMKFNHYYTPYFESWLFPRNCDPKLHLLENRLVSLSQHFKSACIAGPWSLDPEIDAQLKKKYGNLCALCHDPHTCSVQDRYYGMAGVLRCLTAGVGDVAWINRVDASRYFSQLMAYGYSLLCPDGKLVDFSRDSINGTCTWIVDPRPVILANRVVANVVREKITDTGKEGERFFQVIHTAYKFSHLSRLDGAEDMSSYLGRFPGYASGLAKSSGPSCPRSFRWCVSSGSEARKCRSLQRAASVLGIQPVFVCVETPGRDESLRAIRDGKCDVFVARPDQIVAARKLGAKALIDVMANKREDANSVAAIVRRKSRYNTFVDLRGTKACFTGYKSAGWQAFLSTLKNQSVDLGCSDVSTVSSYFKESCVLGLNTEDVNFPKNLYSLCNDTDSKLDLEEKTFQCLMDGADVAFVNVTAAKIYSSRRKIFNIEYRLLCPSNKHEDGHCYLGKMTLGSIVVHENMTKVMGDDVYLAFLQLDSHFGRTFDRETPMFEMYEPFEGETGVIFPSATVKLQRATPGIYGEDLEFANDTSCEFSRSLRAGSEHGLFYTCVFVLLIASCLCFLYKKYHFRKYITLF